MSQEDILKRLETVEKTNAAILSLFRKVLDPEGKMGLNLSAEELIVQVTLQRNQVTKNFDTSTANGRILFCAVEDLKGATFTENEVGKCLAERAWPSSHGAIAPNLSKMVNDNLLIRENGSPAKYRLPGKIVVNVKEA